jgi:hypothetical protein
MPPDDKTFLLEEYRDCSGKIGRLDNLIWQTASVILPITLAGFAYFGLSSSHTPDQFISVLAVGIGSITLLMAWFLLSRNWYFYQLIAFYLLREIETELGLWHYRYALFLRESKQGRVKILEKITKKEKVRFLKLAEQQKDIPRIGLRRTIAFLTTIFSIGWIALIVREYLLTF